MAYSTAVERTLGLRYPGIHNWLDLGTKASLCIEDTLAQYEWRCGPGARRLNASGNKRYLYLMQSTHTESKYLVSAWCVFIKAASGASGPPLIALAGAFFVAIPRPEKWISRGKSHTNSFTPYSAPEMATKGLKCGCVLDMSKKKIQDHSILRIHSLFPWLGFFFFRFSFSCSLSSQG